MIEAFFGWIGRLLVEYIFGALFNVLHVYRLPVYLRYPLALLIVVSYVLIEVFLINEAVRVYHSGNRYLMWLCIIAVILFAILAVTGYLHQNNNM